MNRKPATRVESGGGLGAKPLLNDSERLNIGQELSTILNEMKKRISTKDTEYIRDFQKLLREARLYMGIDQREAAKSAGITNQELCKIERGMVQSFSWLTAAKLIKLYDLGIKDILPD